MKFPQNNIISLLDDRLELNLAESTNQDLVMDEIWGEAFSAGLKKLKLEYGTSQGNDALRALIGQKLQVDKSNIVISNGSAFGIFLAMLCLCEIGEEVITVQPNFPPTMDLIEGLGFKRKILKLSFEDGYRLDENALFQLISDKTKLIILVSPLNPSGTVLQRKEVESISIRLSNTFPHCKLLIDETYREAVYGDNAIIPTFTGIHDNVLTVSSLSKCHGTPGLRLGWIYANNPKLINDLAVAKMNTVISNSVLDEYVATHVLKNEHQIFQARRTHAANGLSLTKQWVELNSEYISWNQPEAGALCCIKLSSEKFNLEQVEDFYALIKEARIQIANGEWFGESKRYFRLGFGYMDNAKLKLTLDQLTQIILSASK